MIRRIVNLVRGMLNDLLVRSEQGNPSAVYESAIAGRLTQYNELRQAAAGVLYMKGKLTRELDLRNVEIRSIDSELAASMDERDDDELLALIVRRDELRMDAERLAGELKEVTAEADAAKRNLIGFQEEIGRLREEKVRMIARWTNAKARRRFQATLRGVSVDEDVQALEGVREFIERSVQELNLASEADSGSLTERLARRRQDDSRRAAREELDRLRAARHGRLLPVVLTSA